MVLNLGHLGQRRERMLEMPLPTRRVIPGPIMMNGRPADDRVDPTEHARGGGGDALP